MEKKLFRVFHSQVQKVYKTNKTARKIRSSRKKFKKCKEGEKSEENLREIRRRQIKLKRKLKNEGKFQNAKQKRAEKTKK